MDGPNAEDRLASPPAAPQPDSGLRKRAHPEYVLRIGGQHVVVDRPRLVIGRSTGADIQLDGALVSRLHAALSLVDGQLVLEDLASRNGVFVNGVLIRQPLPLEAGDQVRVGDTDIEIRVAHAEPTTEDLEDLDDAEDRSTRRVDPFELLEQGFARALADGVAAEAEDMVSGHLRTLLKEADKGRAVPVKTREAATRYALCLAGATGKGLWIDYVLELHTAARELLSLQVIRELFRLASVVRYENPGILRRYIDFVSDNVIALGPNASLILERTRRYGRL